MTRQSTFTFRLDEDLKTAFREVAEEQEHTSAQLLRVLMRDAVDRWRTAQEHDAWVRREVERALTEADSDTSRVTHDQVRSDWRRQRAELEQRAAGRIA